MPHRARLARRGDPGRRTAARRASEVDTSGRSGERDDDGDPHPHHRLGRAPGHPLAGGPGATGRRGARGARRGRRGDSIRARTRGARRAGRDGRRRARHHAGGARPPARRPRAGAPDAGRPCRRADRHRRALAGHDRWLLRRDLRPRDGREARHHGRRRRDHQPRRRRAARGRLLLAGRERAGPAGLGAGTARALPGDRQHRQARADGDRRRAGPRRGRRADGARGERLGGEAPCRAADQRAARHGHASGQRRGDAGGRPGLRRGRASRSAS